MIFSRRFLIRIVDLYFGETTPNRTATDIIRYNQSPKPVQQCTCNQFSTIVLDLSHTAEELFSGFKKHTRNSIRRAANEGLIYESFRPQNLEETMVFIKYYDRCAYMKGLAPVSRERFRILSNSHALSISFIRGKGGDILAASSYLLAGSRVRNLLAAAAFRTTQDSILRALIGRANRYLYWSDILAFQRSGVCIFDFGGWYNGDTDDERMRINNFKSEFGGVLLHEFNCERAITWRGKVALLAMKRRRRNVTAAAGSRVAHTEETCDQISASV